MAESLFHRVSFRQIFGDNVPYSILRAFLLLLAFSVFCGCTAWQPTKEVWKTTKELWYDYVSPPASVDYGDKGSVAPEGLALSSAIMGIDSELGRLERVMQNADRPPTQEWLSGLFSSFPWLNGFAGVKYDGTILGQEPPNSLKQLDFIPLLYEDKKQSSRALRADVQPGPLGPEVMLATPLYDGVDFLGIVVAYFDMRSLMRFSNQANDIVVLAPSALLWPGKYDFASTPLAGVEWNKVVRESTAGTCSNNAGTFYYMVRYLGNLPMIFAIPAKGTFPEGNGGLEQGNAFFPQEREKLPPPPVPERKSSSEARIPIFEKPVEPEPEPEAQNVAPPMPEASDKHVIQQGSRESMLLQKQRQAKKRQLQERQLEGENIQYEPHRRRSSTPSGPPLDLIPDSDTPKLPGGRPSPFGPRPGADAPSAAPEQETARPGSLGPEGSAESQSATPESAASGQATPAVPTARPASGSAQGIVDGEKGPVEPDAAAKEAAKPVNPSESQSASDTASRLADGEKGTAESGGAAKEATEDTQPHKPAMLPGGRPSPFGPRS